MILFKVLWGFVLRTRLLRNVSQYGIVTPHTIFLFMMNGVQVYFLNNSTIR